MAHDFIPRQDGAYDAWQQTFLSYINANLGALGLAPGDVAPLLAARAQWQGDLAAASAARAAAQAATQAKNESRAACESLARALARRLAAGPAVGNPERAAMGLTVPDRVHTPGPPPAEAPGAVVDHGERLRHVLRFFAPGREGRGGRPAGVTGVQVFAKVGGEAPRQESELRFLGAATRPRFVARFSMAEAGLAVHYRARWVGPRGQVGPWGEVVSATVAA